MTAEQISTFLTGAESDADTPTEPPSTDTAEAGEVGDPGRDAPSVLRRNVEAVLMVVDQPVGSFELARAFECSVEDVTTVLRELSAEYTEQGRGFDLREVAEGWRIYTRVECASAVERFLRDGAEVRLTQAALETLAVVAYRQPVSRGRVSAVRGVNCDGVMRTLVLRGLIVESGQDGESGALLYRTTNYFLERMGLRDLEELPDLAQFLPDDIEGFDDTGEHPTSQT